MFYDNSTSSNGSRNHDRYTRSLIKTERHYSQRNDVSLKKDAVKHYTYFIVVQLVNIF